MEKNQSSITIIGMKATVFPVIFSLLIASHLLSLNGIEDTFLACHVTVL